MPAAKPHVHLYNINNIPPVANSAPEYAGGQIVERQILSNHKDGSTKADVTYTVYKAGAHMGRVSDPGEQICWLEAGELEVSSDGVTSSLKEKDFLYRPDGATIDGIRAVKDSKMLCFFGPARR
jgi:glyoxylate utilization-related uncharacterized protein